MSGVVQSEWPEFEGHPELHESLLQNTKAGVDVA